MLIEALMLVSIVGQASVIDGDTIEIRGARIRLEGIDAPEAAQSCLTAQGTSWPCGRRAAFALADRIAQTPVSCEQTGQDRYRRILARCSVGGEDLGAFMVGQGWALAYRRYSERYIAHEESAARAKRGKWVGSFEAPWDWRRTRQRAR